MANVLIQLQQLKGVCCVADHRGTASPTLLSVCMWERTVMVTPTTLTFNGRQKNPFQAKFELTQLDYGGCVVFIG